jgi:predicted transcriptional regulator
MRTVTGESVKAARKAIGLSLRGLGEKLGVTASYLSDVEKGRRGISLANLEAIRLRAGWRIVSEPVDCAHCSGGGKVYVPFLKPFGARP